MSEGVSITMLLECVARAFGKEPRALRGARGPATLSDARQAVYLLAHELTRHGSTTIGRRLGGRDHKTVIHGIDAAAARCARDADYALAVDAARQAAISLSRSSLASMLRDADAIGAAGRICANPAREATRVSSDELVAMAARLLDLEDAAGATFQLLLKIDDMAALGSSCSAATRLRRRELALAICSFTETLASALATLGYHKEIENEQSPEEENDRLEPAGAANAG